MSRNFKELQAKMDPGSRAENMEAVRNELQRMALDELRQAKRLTQAYLAEMLDAPQSSISRIEQRADMYLSTLRDHVHAMGGVLQIQAVFPDGGTVAINRFGEYEERSYVVRAQVEGRASYRLYAQALGDGRQLSTKVLKGRAFAKTLGALHIPELQIAAIQKCLEAEALTEVGGQRARRFFGEADLVAAGFEVRAGE